jgi:uncharacterized protein YhdP
LKELDAKVTGKINTQSERLVEFLKRAPLDESVHEVLNSINLSKLALSFLRGSQSASNFNSNAFN